MPTYYWVTIYFLSFNSALFKMRTIISNFLFSIIDAHIGKVSSIIKSEMEDLENPRVGPEAGLRDFFMYHCEQFEEMIRSLSDATVKGFDTPISLNLITNQVQELGHKVYFLLTYGGPLSRSGSDIQKGERTLYMMKGQLSWNNRSSSN